MWWHQHGLPHIIVQFIFYSQVRVFCISLRLFAMATRDGRRWHHIIYHIIKIQSCCPDKVQNKQQPFQTVWKIRFLSHCAELVLSLRDLEALWNGSAGEWEDLTCFGDTLLAWLRADSSGCCKRLVNKQAWLESNWATIRAWWQQGHEEGGGIWDVFWK